MTQNRRLKKRVRARIAKTGESYTTAYQFFRNNAEKTAMSEHEFQTITDNDFGFTLNVPNNWRNVGPDIYNSAFEVARYLKNSDNLHEGIVNIFWGIPGDSTSSVAEKWRKNLEGEGIKKISLTDVKVGDRPAMRLDHEYKLGNIDVWSSRSYFMALRDTVVCLNMGTSDANRDRHLFDQITDSFEPIERGVGIVFVRDESTPASFVTELLEDTFSYRPDQATQRLVRLNAQRECTVALVAEDEAESIVESLNERSKKAGYSAICRATG